MFIQISAYSINICKQKYRKHIWPSKKCQSSLTYQLSPVVLAVVVYWLGLGLLGMKKWDYLS